MVFVVLDWPPVVVFYARKLLKDSIPWIFFVCVVATFVLSKVASCKTSVEG